MRVIHLIAAAAFIATPTVVSAAPLIEVAFDSPAIVFFDYGREPVGNRNGFEARSSVRGKISPASLSVALAAMPLDRFGNDLQYAAIKRAARLGLDLASSRGTINKRDMLKQRNWVQFTFNESPFSITPVSPVPEPATWAVLVLGFGLIGYAMRGRTSCSTSVQAQEARCGVE